MAGTTPGLTLDASSLATLKARAASDPKAAVKEAAKQFETLFMNELVKSMRASTLASGMMDGGEGGAMATEMLDTQLAGKLSGLPGGLADVIAKQLERQMGLTPGPIPVTTSANNTPEPLSATPKATQIPQVGAAGFVQQHTAAAQAAEAQTGIPATFMVAQAAHETGWGRKEIRNADGSPSYNLFGIKAGPGWTGPTTDVTTTEYVNGKAQKVVQRFRAYASYEESFTDYAKLVKDSPRYAKLTQTTAAAASSAVGTATTTADASRFARGLQRAGYATDPAYAEKLTRMINQTLRIQRSIT